MPKKLLTINRELINGELLTWAYKEWVRLHIWNENYGSYDRSCLFIRVEGTNFGVDHFKHVIYISQDMNIRSWLRALGVIE